MQMKVHSEKNRPGLFKNTHANASDIFVIWGTITDKRTLQTTKLNVSPLTTRLKKEDKGYYQAKGNI